MKDLLNKIYFKLIQNPFITSIISTIFLLILMQFTIPFDPMLLVLNLILTYWTMKTNFMVIE